MGAWPPTQRLAAVRRGTCGSPGGVLPAGLVVSTRSFTPCDQNKFSLEKLFREETVIFDTRPVFHIQFVSIINTAISLHQTCSQFGNRFANDLPVEQRAKT